MVIGGGIVGLASAWTLCQRGHAVTVLEKQDRWASHQTGRNSNVVHAGLYYRPGSFKARMSVAGNASMIRFAREHGVPVDVCGKLIVATCEAELPRLRELARRAEANGVPIEELDPPRAREFEPEVACVSALRVSTTAVTDFARIASVLVELLAKRDADLRLHSPVTGIRVGRAVEVEAGGRMVRGEVLVNCAGLHADRVARLAGLSPSARIVPFRGEYHHIARPELVRGLIYPVPDPALPFLGVHLTRMLDGSLHAGPNAVLALHREGYRWRDVSVRDTVDTVRFPGTWRLAGRFARAGMDEITRSLSTARFARALARLVPSITERDLLPAPAGVRAQALTRRGALVDDFLIESAARQIHVLNAPSPAATSALEIGAHLADQVESMV